MKKYWFGYAGCTLVYWLYVKSRTGLLKQIDAKGMRKPDWIDGE